MKTLILYASNGGCSEKCAALLAGKLAGETTLHNLKDPKVPDFSGFDWIILGSGIRAGRIYSIMERFLQKNIAALLSHNTAAFLCCGFPEKAEDYFSDNFPATLLSALSVKDSFGGEMNLASKGLTGFIIRMVAKSMEKDNKPLPKIDTAKIEAFAQTINNAK